MKNMLRTLTAALVLLLAASAHADDWLRIGSWNIENLGDRGFGQAAPALAEHLHLAGVDVLALQEIHDTDGDPQTRTSRELDDVFEILNRQDGQDWAYRLFRNRRADDTTQLCGVAWNRAKVSLVGDPFRIPIVDNSPFNLWDRAPHAAKFSTGAGRSDFVVVSVHMKSNVGSNVKRQRREEAEALVAQLDEVRDELEDRDVIIIGDTNVKRSSERAIEIFTGAGFRDLNPDDRTTFVSGRSPFDRVFVPTGESEFRFSRQYLLQSAVPGRHDSNLSDHHLILVSVRIEEDDDP